MAIDYGDVVIAACKATASVGVLSFVGIVLAWRGILDQDGIKVFSRVGQKLLIPCLTFISISGSMSVSYFEENWGLIVAGVAQMALGAVIGRLAVGFSGAKPGFKPFFVLACTFPNVFAIPLVFIEAICRGETDKLSEAEECIANASTRLFTLIMFFPVLLYGFGTVYAQLALDRLPRDDVEVSATHAPELKADSDATFIAGTAEMQEEQKTEEGRCTTPTVIDIDAIAVNVEPSNSPAAPDEGHGEELKNTSQPQKTHPAEKVGSFRWQLRVILLENPPVIATIVAILVALIKPVRESLYGPSAPLQFATNAIAVLAKSVPCISNLTMAASLGCQLMKLDKVSDIFGGTKAGISRWTLFMLVVTKMLLIPAIHFTILTLVVDSLPEDRWYRLLLFIEAETPTANNVVLLANILGQFESAQILALSTVTQLVFFLPISTVFTAAGLAMTADLKDVSTGSSVLDVISANVTNMSNVSAVISANLTNMSNGSA